jgi:Protein of unknown function (DUF2867)
MAGIVVQQFTSPDDSYLSAPVVRTLFTIRWRLGALFGWDKPCVDPDHEDRPGSAMPTRPRAGNRA